MGPSPNRCKPLIPFVEAPVLPPWVSPSPVEVPLTCSARPRSRTKPFPARWPGRVGVGLGRGAAGRSELSVAAVLCRPQGLQARTHPLQCFCMLQCARLVMPGAPSQASVHHRPSFMGCTQLRRLPDPEERQKGHRHCLRTNRGGKGGKPTVTARTKHVVCGNGLPVGERCPAFLGQSGRVGRLGGGGF